MKKIFFYSTLLFFILFSINTKASVWISNEDISDPELTTEFYDAIQYVKAQGIVNGYSDGTYRPDNNVTRGEFIKIIINSNFTVDELQACTGTSFPDIDVDNKFKDYICFARNRGIINGFSDGTFRSDSEIEFGTAAKIIVNTFAMNPDLTLITETDKFKPYVLRLAEIKAIPTSIDKLDKKLTRGELAEIIFRIKTSPDKPSKTYEELTVNILVQGISVSSPHKIKVGDVAAFQCNCAKTCVQIQMCAEAYYQLQHCGCDAIDEDNNGVPCENLCKV